MPPAARVLFRGLTKCCPWCGSRRLFSGWFTMREHCPGCGLRFDREEGYWLGAMAINLGVTEACFFAALVVGAVATWPEVPWGWLTAICVAVNVVVPLAFYPFSKTLWVACDLLMHRGDPVDRSSWLGG